MVILTKDPVWESQDAKALGEFYETQTGQRFLSNVAALIPSLADGGHVNKTLVTNGEVKGWTAALDAMISLLKIQPPQPRVEENYHSLDDEAYWKDHEKPTE